MGYGKAPMLSQMERAILGSLHDDGPASAVDLVARLRPSWRPQAAFLGGGSRAHRGIEASLTYLRHLQIFAAAGLVTKDDCGVFSINVAGTRLVERHRMQGVPELKVSQGRGHRNWVKVVGGAGVLLHLSSCSSLAPSVPAAETPTQGLELSLSYDMQQFRDEQGSVGFRSCGTDCEKPTPKTLAVARLDVHRPAGHKVVEDPTVAAVPLKAVGRMQEVKPVQKSAPAALYRVYFRFGTADFGPGALKALSAALPELKTMDRIEVAAGADPVGTTDKNLQQIQLRQEAVKAYLVRHGVPEARIALVQAVVGSEGAQVKGMAPRQSRHAEMRRADILAHAGATAHAAR